RPAPAPPIPADGAREGAPIRAPGSWDEPVVHRNVVAGIGIGGLGHCGDDRVADQVDGEWNRVDPFVVGGLLRLRGGLRAYGPEGDGGTVRRKRRASDRGEARAGRGGNPL